MMTYNQFVRRPGDLKRCIEHKIEDVQFKWNICIGVVPSMDEKVQTSVKNTSESSILRYADAKKELDHLQRSYDAAVDEVREFLYEELKADEADVLDWRYCGDKSIGEIAEIKSLSYSGAANKVRRADMKAAQIYNLSRFEKDV
jgi:hypothetical protein